MKIKLNTKNIINKNNKIDEKGENNKNNESNKNKKIRLGNTKEYKIDTQNLVAKFVTSDNIIKLEKAEVKTRTGYVNGKKSKIKKYVNSFFKNEKNVPKKYYGLLFFMILLAIISIVLVIKNYNFTDLEDYITYSLNEEVAVTVSSSIDSSEVDIAEVVLEDISENTVVTSSEKKEKVEELVFTSPMEGEISKVYSPDKVIYSKTLELWKTHDGIDIKGELGQNVVAIEKGKVTKVYEDSFLGYTVVLEHIQGYSSAYSNLSENIPVKVGEIVTKGEIIGQISNSAIGEIKDDPHLHFTLMKDSEIIDPTYVIKN